MKAKTDDKFLTDNQSNIAFSGEMNIIKSGDLDYSSLLSITGDVVYKTNQGDTFVVCLNRLTRSQK
jgi:hypothetical protein